MIFTTAPLVSLGPERFRIDRKPFVFAILETSTSGCSMMLNDAKADAAWLNMTENSILCHVAETDRACSPNLAVI